MLQVYNYMLESLPVKREVRYPVSRRNELKKVYSDIVNLNKRSPFYKINLSKENQEYTIGLKETALTLETKLNAMFDPQISGFHNKTVSVSDERILSAKLLNENTGGLPNTIEFNVKSLASVQINRGKELLQTSRALPIRQYDFRVKVMDETYSLTYVQKERMENQDTLINMADYLNQSVPGLNAFVETGSKKDYSRLMIVSDMSGRFGDKKFTFEDSVLFGEGIVDFFGLDRMEKSPSYAKFDLNGVEKQTATNTFTLENTLRITLHNSSEQPVSLRIVPDSEKILSAVDSILATYNDIIRLAKDRTLGDQDHYRASKLISEMKSLEELYKEELEACGLTTKDDGSLVMDDALAVQAAQDGGIESLFTRENGFIARLFDKAEAIAINPMEYLDKTIVTYPNNEKNAFHNPYVTSIYSGLFFSSYC